MLSSILFYVFGSLMVLSSIGVITAKNSVYAVLLLIFTFFNAAGLFLLMGAEYLAMLLVIVYVGAVAVLFLFVVMMLNINASQFTQKFSKYLPLGLILAALIFAEMVLLTTSKSNATLIGRIDSLNQIANTNAIGNRLYTEYFYPFQVSGVILFIAMIGAIVLTHRVRGGVRRQKISEQVNRTNTIELH
jgi:NADH-quinone oxidoreductase subunit J